MSQFDEASAEYVADVQSDPLRGLLDLAELALRRGMPGIDLELLGGGLRDVPEDDFIDGWPPDNPPWPDAENLPEDDD